MDRLRKVARYSNQLYSVMAGLVPAIHEHGPWASGKWMAATRAAMTIFLFHVEKKKAAGDAALIS